MLRGRRTAGGGVDVGGWGAPAQRSSVLSSGSTADKSNSAPEFSSHDRDKRDASCPTLTADVHESMCLCGYVVVVVPFGPLQRANP